MRPQVDTMRKFAKLFWQFDFDFETWLWGIPMSRPKVKVQRESLRFKTNTCLSSISSVEPASCCSVKSIPGFWRWYLRWYLDGRTDVEHIFFQKCVSKNNQFHKHFSKTVYFSEKSLSKHIFRNKFFEDIIMCFETNFSKTYFFRIIFSRKYLSKHKRYHLRKGITAI